MFVSSMLNIFKIDLGIGFMFEKKKKGKRISPTLWGNENYTCISIVFSFEGWGLGAPNYVLCCEEGSHASPPPPPHARAPPPSVRPTDRAGPGTGTGFGFGSNKHFWIIYKQ